MNYLVKKCGTSKEAMEYINRELTKQIALELYKNKLLRFNYEIQRINGKTAYRAFLDVLSKEEY